MNNTTKIIVAVAVVGALAGAAFWAYKKHPEWFGRQTQNPNQVNPAVPQRDKLSDRINAASNALDSISNAAGSILG